MACTTQWLELMTNRVNPNPQLDYSALITKLFEIDRTERPQIDLNQVAPHFIAIQSLIRASVEYTEAAHLLANQGNILPALALLRSVFDHFILASYLEKSPDGPTETRIILDKNGMELGKKAQSIGVEANAKALIDQSRSTLDEMNSISTRTSNLINRFNEADALHAFYFLLGQSVHPKAAFFQYFEIDESTGAKTIRRTSLDQDKNSVHPFTFQLLRATLLLDAKTRKLPAMSELLQFNDFNLGFNPDLHIKGNS